MMEFGLLLVHPCSTARKFLMEHDDIEQYTSRKFCFNECSCETLLAKFKGKFLPVIYYRNLLFKTCAIKIEFLKQAEREDATHR